MSPVTTSSRSEPMPSAASRAASAMRPSTRTVIFRSGSFSRSLRDEAAGDEAGESGDERVHSRRGTYPVQTSADVLTVTRELPIDSP